MGIVDRWLRQLFDAPIRTAVQEAVAAAPAASLEPLYRPRIHGDTARLHVDPTAVVNDALFNLSSGEVWVGPFAFFGHGVAVLTGTHDITKLGPERQLAIPRSGRDVRIGEGAWLATQVLVLGPCTIGEHSVVAAGSLVTRDVEPYTVVAGRPAKALRSIRSDGDDGSGRRGDAGEG